MSPEARAITAVPEYPVQFPKEGLLQVIKSVSQSFSQSFSQSVSAFTLTCPIAVSTEDVHSPKSCISKH